MTWEVRRFAPGEIHPAPPNTGIYVAVDPATGYGVGFLAYRDSQGVLSIIVISTHPDYRRRGVAKRLMLALAADHPEHRIDLGQLTAEGRAFISSVTGPWSE